MTHQIDPQSQDLAAWQDWARWPDIPHATRVGAGFGASLGVISLLVVDLRRVFGGTVPHSQPLRVTLFGVCLIAANALVFGLLSAAIAGVIRLVRRRHLSLKRRAMDG